MSTRKESKFNKEIGHKEVVNYLKSKGFYQIEKQQGDPKGSITKKFSYIRFGHPKLDGLGLTKLFTPELIFYYDPSDITGFFFHLGITLAKTDRSCFIPFFGKYHTIVRKNKTLARVSEHLKELFDNYVDFIDFIQDMRKIELDKKSRNKFLSLLVEQRFHKYFISHDKEIELSKTNNEQFLIDIPGLREPDSMFGIYVRFIFANLDREYFVPQTFYFKEPETGKIRPTVSRKPIENVYRIRQFFDLCSDVLFKTYTKHGNMKFENDDPDVFFM